MKTLIGIVTFGNLPFTKLTIEEIRRTTKSPVDFFVIVGKPDDTETSDWLCGQIALRDHTLGLPRITMYHHKRNMGFPASCNDLLDRAFNSNSLFAAAEPYDNLIIVGNDVVVYPGAVDALIETARATEYEWVSGSMFDVHSLLARYPEAQQYFEGPQCVFTDFTARPWDLHTEFHQGIAPGALTDVQNLCLYKRAVFEKLGYFDVNFWPNGYFSDNDYQHRAVLAGINGCTVKQAAYFHFWSRTIYQGGERPNGKYFEGNRTYYERKWGGPVNGERVKNPRGEFGGLKIATRQYEAQVLEEFLRS